MSRLKASSSEWVGVRYWINRQGDVEFAPWEPGQQAKYLAQTMHQELQGAAEDITPELTEDALPAIALVGQRRVEIYPALLRILRKVCVLSLPLRGAPLAVTLLDQIVGSTHGIPADQFLPLTIANLPTGLVRGMMHLAAVQHNITLDEHGRPRTADDRTALTQAADELWAVVQQRVIAMAAQPPNILIPVAQHKVLPSHIRKTIERTMLTLGFEQARLRGELGNNGDRYLPAPYARHVASATQGMLSRLKQRKVAISYLRADGEPATLESNLQEVKEWNDRHHAAFDLARTERIASLIVADGQAPAMLTITLPPSWHATAQRSAGSAPFAGWSVVEGVELLQRWFRQSYLPLYKANRKLGHETFLVRAVEPHTDGTAHMHIVGGERDLWSIADRIARTYPLEVGQRLCRIVEHRCAAGENFTQPTRFPTYQTRQDWDANRPVRMGMVGVAMQLDAFRSTSPEVAQRLVMYLTRYLRPGDDAGDEQDLAALLNDRTGKPKGPAALAWRRAAGLKSRDVGWSGIDAKKSEWLGVFRKSVAKKTPDALACVLDNLLRDWARGVGTWEELKTRHGVTVTIDDEKNISVFATMGTQGDDGTSSTLGGPVRQSIVERVPDLLGSPPHLHGAKDFARDLEQIAYRERVCDSRTTSPPPAEELAGGRGERHPVVDAETTTLPELSTCDILGAIEGIPIQAIAGPGVGKTTAIGRGLLQWQGMHDHAGERASSVLLLYRQRHAAVDTTEKLRRMGVRANLHIGRQHHDQRANALMNAALDAPVVIAATVDSLLCGRLRGWRGVVFVDEVQDMHPAQIDNLWLLEQQGSITIGLIIGDQRQALLPDAPPALVENWGTAWLRRGLRISHRCPSAIAHAASLVAPQYPPIVSARDGGTFTVETLDTRRDALAHAAQRACDAFEVGHSVVVQADTHESLHRIRMLLRQRFGQRIPEGIDIRTPAGAKGGTWNTSIYVIDIQLGGMLAAERPSEVAATAISRASDAAHVVSYELAD